MGYVRNAWYVASWSQEVEPNTLHPVTILQQPIVIWRDGNGNLAALEDRCVHRLAPLSLGRCEGEHLRCMYHGLLFNKSGAVVEIPGQDIVPPQARVRSYPVVDVHSWLWVWMGDPALADAALIPPAVGLDHPDYVLGHGELFYEAEARLINDNLLDFSHLSYVHANSFGATDQWARRLPKITTLDRGLRFERWLEDEAAAPGQSLTESSDRYSRYDFLLPGVLLMTGGIFPRGTAAKLERGTPDLDEALGGITFTSQAVTPVTEKTSRYFFSWGPHRNSGDEKMRDQLMKIAGMAFAEDKVMIEAQQKIIDATPDQRIMPTAADRGVVMFNRMVDRLVRQEQGETLAA